jgi:hypothetical protein
MDVRRVLEELVTEVAPNAAVADVEDRGTHCRISLVGTTGVVAACEIPRAMVEALDRDRGQRERVAAALKRCADDVVASFPDGRT